MPRPGLDAGQVQLMEQVVRRRQTHRLTELLFKNARKVLASQRADTIVIDGSSQNAGLEGLALLGGEPLWSLGVRPQRPWSREA
jgi:hypothetical protein